MKGIQAILFDFDNTLTDFHQASRLSFEDLHSHYSWTQTEEDYEVYLRHNHAAWRAFERGELDGVELRRRRFERYLKHKSIFGLDELEINGVYLEGVLRHTALYAGVLELLGRLQSDYQLGVVTNGMREVQRRRIEKVGLVDLVSAMTISDEIGVAKPDPLCFDHALRQMKGIHSPAQVLIVGDGLNPDIKGGKKYGMRTAWIRVEGHERSAYADYTIRSVLELENLLE